MAGRPIAAIVVAGLLCAMLAALAGCSTLPPNADVPAPVARDPLMEYARLADQPTGIAISSDARIFISFPRWDKAPAYSVAELLTDGSLRPYPDSSWNRWVGQAGDPQLSQHFICVQSVVVDKANNLWILDPASPSFKGVIRGGAKLVKVNLASDRVEQVILFDDSVIQPNSYLNDVRIDTARGVAYITDSGAGAIVVTNLKDGTSRRVLARSPSTKAEAGYVSEIDGKPLLQENGRPPQIHADGIALDSGGDYLYYHALNARGLYRIGTKYLTDPALSAEQMAARVEKVMETSLVDGMLMDEEGNLYLTLPVEKGIKRLGKDGNYTTVVRDPRLQWPDSLALSPDKVLYMTDSQINKMPRFNGGKDRRVLPYRVYKILLPMF
ncbi:L-dopachrome tautomerase-related protein [Geobacter sp. SVR]|uniref:L-dopachrome tautomerase-related protein n=1 Tax=Geobacter sp. SVR TaxID=2495594 RepID=UPI00143EFB4A|nr:L-dopachrome tautomerase-related protein [Geobacter sp. SVR]BCS53875.1 gluconolactonase [Geobacter sp. SVR]GCF85616.1 hypothetical protein GSbR_22160 [Geobacter sp. SVR]